MANKKKCLIVYHFFAHYRQHIMHELMECEDWDFEMISAVQTEADIKGIDPELARTPLADGGLNWTFVENVYILGRRFPFIWQRGLLKRLSRDDYDAVIFLGSMYFVSTWFSVRKLRTMGKVILFWTHGMLGKDRPFMEKIRNYFYRKVDRCLLYGDRARDIMYALGGYKQEQLRVIYNSLDYASMERLRLNMNATHRKQIRNRLFQNPDNPILVAIGRVTQEKRFDLLLPALDILRQRGLALNLLIIGDGPYLGLIREAASNLKLNDAINFYGAAYGSEADELLLVSDICVIPGDVGLSAMHAMSAGLPVVSHNEFNRQMPEHEAIVDGVSGSFYEFESEDDLAQKIAFWATGRRYESAKQECIDIIKQKYNSTYQVRVIREVLNELVCA